MLRILHNSASLSLEGEPKDDNAIVLLLLMYVALPIKAENVKRMLQPKKEHYRVWKTIGTELGIDVDELSAIEKDHTDDEDRLHAVINGANPAPTHETMVKILQSSNITSAIAGTVMWLSLFPRSYPVLISCMKFGIGDRVCILLYLSEY